MMNYFKESIKELKLYFNRKEILTKLAIFVVVIGVLLVLNITEVQETLFTFFNK